MASLEFDTSSAQIRRLLVFRLHLFSVTDNMIISHLDEKCCEFVTSKLK